MTFFQRIKGSWHVHIDETGGVDCFYSDIVAVEAGVGELERETVKIYLFTMNSSLVPTLKLEKARRDNYDTARCR